MIRKLGMSVAVLAAMAACAGSGPVERALAFERNVGGAVPAMIKVADATGQSVSELTGAVGDSGYGAYLAGRHAEGMSDFGAAATLLDRVLEENPEDPRLIRRAFLANVNAGRFERAVELARKIDSQSPIGMGLATLIESADALKRGDYAEAARLADAAERTGLSRYAAPIFAAWARAAAGETDAAIEALSEIDADSGFGPLLALHTGLIQKQAGRLDAALRTLTPVMPDSVGPDSVGPDSSPTDEAPTDGAQTNGGDDAAGSDMGGEGEAAARAEAVARMPVRMVRAYARVRLANGAPAAEVLAMMRDYDGANPGVTIIERDIAALEADGTLEDLVVGPAAGVAEGLYHLASSVQRQAEGIALGYGRLAVFLDPGMELSRLLVSEILESRGRHAEAIEELRMVPESSDYAWSAQLAVADNLIELDRDAEAAAHLERMATTRPDDIDALMKLGYLMRLRERFDEGADVYARVLDRIETIRPEHWLVLYYRGITLERTDRWPEAEDAFLKALDLKPGDPYVLNYLGYSWVDKGMNIDRAKEMIRDAVAQRQNDGYIVDSLGWVQYKLGNYEEAVRHLERAVQLRPQDPVINDHLGDAYWRVGRRLEARFQWDRALSLDPDEELVETIDDKLDSGLETDPESGVGAESDGAEAN
ncbi:tetratricopeptide repeat protein [Marivibrio halodurans]|uniref:Tetratricopeptide repeat protein n=1 Tax=Marivibrio halodurans TaxID=2039722 RepID=A0A8J7S207_9PROT|nr:tetratricopeptide repeat protein [Marivibrio halodurans]MBP5858400.1 tetratricopeptide repeat protein [Marivibrio halodurans]